jgi:hypothetical protein
VKSEKYKTRKSPAFHAGECKGLTKKGKDGTYISRADSRGVYKWVKASSNTTRKSIGTKGTKGAKGAKGTKKYLIHNNGGRPYRVDVSGKLVEIYKGKPIEKEDKSIDFNEEMDYSELLRKLIVKDIHVGQSPCIPAADSCGPSDKGNSILLHISGKTYMYIGHEIYIFSMEDTFEAYYSMIGNNDVPYPIILGSKYVYFMLDYTYLPRDVFKTKMTSNTWADAYSYYFGFRSLETGEEVRCDEKATKDRIKCMKARGEVVKKLGEKKFKITLI